MKRVQDDKDQPATSRCEAPSKTFVKEHVTDAKALRQEHTWCVREMETPRVGGTQRPKGHVLSGHGKGGLPSALNCWGGW